MPGFYQASASPAARMTHIVGDGRSAASETVLFDGPGRSRPIRSSARKARSGTIPRSSEPATGRRCRFGAVEVAPGMACSQTACATARIVFSTGVADTDGDGLLDVWESSTTRVSRSERAAAAESRGDGRGPVPEGPLRRGRLHGDDSPRPRMEASRSRRTRIFRHAGVLEAGGRCVRATRPRARIHVHFDVGERLPGRRPTRTSSALQAWPAAATPSARRSTQQCARGLSDPPGCASSRSIPGTVGWKTGFRFLRDEVFSVTPTPPVTNPPTPLEDYCDAPGYTCDRRFDRNRKDMFRYALFAHALGLPKSEEPDGPRLPRARGRTPASATSRVATSW